MLKEMAKTNEFSKGFIPSTPFPLQHFLQLPPSLVMSWSEHMALFQQLLGHEEDKTTAVETNPLLKRKTENGSNAYVHFHYIVFCTDIE